MNRMNITKYENFLHFSFQSFFINLKLILYLIYILMISVFDRYIYDFLKAFESINIFIQYIAFSNMFNIDYMSDIFHAESFNKTFSKVLLSNFLKFFI